jgi:hypothetical protein
MAEGLSGSPQGDAIEHQLLCGNSHTWDKRADVVDRNVNSGVRHAGIVRR